MPRHRAQKGYILQWDRERYLAYLSGEHVERPMLVELFGLLLGLEEQWREQGATEAEVNLHDFAFDTVLRVYCGAITGPRMGPVTVIEDTPTRRVERDAWGRILERDKRTATLSLPRNYPVETMEDWLDLKPDFAWSPDRVDQTQLDEARTKRHDGYLVRASIPGGYDMLRELMGDENACMAFYDQPELVRDVIDTLRDTSLRVLDAVSRQVTIDYLGVHEDFAGRGGPIIGPEVFRQFIGPYYRAAWDLVHRRGARVFDIDSDGNLMPILDALLEAGINQIHPCEPAAGMDIVAIRRRYGQTLSTRGGINKFALLGSVDDIRRELERVCVPELMRGGVVFGLDHRIPNGVSLDNYRYYVDTARHLLGLPPRRTIARPYWERSA